MNSRTQHIWLGMSGGVDSAVSALLLKQQGWQVNAIFMKNWQADDDDDYCNAAEDFAAAQAVCQQLHIPLRQVNFSQDYWQRVFQHFLREYQQGRTPNPDILCNQEIKFRAFLHYAKQEGADYIATGHYARVQHDTMQLLKGIDNAKDQSYFLHRLTQAQLQHCVFPLGDWHKPRVREFAKTHGLVNHQKKDSTGICFIGERPFKAFLQEYLPAKPGDIVTETGETIGQHDGIMYYTIGQRQGLNIGGLSQHKQQPWYVVDKDVERNVLIVAQGNDHPLLYGNTLMCHTMHWINPTVPTLPLTCTAKIRYRQNEQACELTQVTHQTYQVQFSRAQRAITPGQAIVFYQGDVCLGGGTIGDLPSPTQIRYDHPG